MIVTKSPSTRYFVQIHKYQSGDPALVFSDIIADIELGEIGNGAPSFDIDSIDVGGYIFITATANGLCSVQFEINSNGNFVQTAISLG